MPGFGDINWGFSSPSSPLSGMGMPDAGIFSPGYQITPPNMSSMLPAFGQSKPGGGLFAGMNGMDKLNLGISGLGTLGNLWAAWNAQKLARDQFKYTKNVSDTNLANQLKTYNTALTDRANNRAIVEGRTPTQTQDYITANSLSRYGRG